MTYARAAQLHRRMDIARGEAMARDGSELVERHGALMRHGDCRKDMRMMGRPSQPKVLLQQLRQRTGGRGNAYLTGWLAPLSRSLTPGTMTNIALASSSRFRHAPLLLLALAFVLFFVLASRFVDPFILVSQKGPLGGDTYGGAEIFLKLKYEWKRPLMGPVVWAATSLFRLIPGVVPTTAIALGLALLATLNLSLAYHVARRLTAGGPDRRPVGGMRPAGVRRTGHDRGRLQPGG